MKIHGTAKGGALSKKDFGVAFGEAAPGFIEATGGSTSTDGDYKVHQFTSSGTFEITSGSGDVEYLVIGGGGGTSTTNGGGGGAGAFRTDTKEDMGVGEYTVTIGAGSDGTTEAGFPPDNGGDSVFDDITAKGGGYGGRGGQNGGSSTGGSGGGSGNSATGGSSGAYGNDGGSDSGGERGGGGGGSGSAGASGNASGNGGNGTASDIIEDGTDVTYAGGGGAAGQGGSARGLGGSGGGGNGNNSGVGANATGYGSGGGGGANDEAGGNGSDGLVVLRYQFQ